MCKNFIKYRFIFLFFSLFFSLNIICENNGLLGLENTHSFVNLDEYIELFDSKIIVNKDASLQVQETIEYVNVNKRVRGIYRDFPTVYNYGVFRDVANFDLISVQKDGHKEPYHMDIIKGGYRIYIGDKDVYLAPGKYSYKINYKIDKVIGFYENHDELYWDVNGTGWHMQIARIRAKVFLPEGFSKEKVTLDAYTGFAGDKGKDFVFGFEAFEQGKSDSQFLDTKGLNSKKLGNNKFLNGKEKLAGKCVAKFETTRNFEPKENISIVVTWPKGFVNQPTWFIWFWEFLKDNYLLIISIILLILLLIYSIVLYLKHTVSQSVETVIPLFYPSKDLSPADMRYISRFGYDEKCFAAEVVNMAVNGLIKIKYESGFFKNNYILIKNNLPGDIKFGDAKSVNEKSGQVEFGDIKSGKAESGDAKSCNTKYSYLLDRLFSKIDLIFSILGSWSPGPTENDEPNCKETQSSIELSQKNSSIIRDVSKKLKKSISGSFGKYFLVYTKYIDFSVISLIFIFVTYMINENILQIYVGVFFVAIFGLFTYLLLGYEPEGLKLKAQIDGFKMFLEATEKDRFDIIGTPPDRTPQLYEKYLPYAIALDVEKQWSRQFVPVFERLERAGTPYIPIWYMGSGHFTKFDAGTFSSNLVDMASDLSKSITKASGSSGAGSSGGGRGGGGGGSW